MKVFINKENSILSIAVIVLDRQLYSNRGYKYNINIKSQKAFVMKDIPFSNIPNE